MQVSPKSFDPELMAALNEVAVRWHDSVNRPKIPEDILLAWDVLLIEWIKDATMPLFVRSSKGTRGTEVLHKDSNRVLIPSDNSPAQWAFTLAESGKKPTLDDIRNALLSDTIPFGFAIKASDKQRIKYSCTLGKVRGNPNNCGWKIGHINPVGMNKPGHFREFPIKVIKTHFLNLMSPRNMYVVPKAWSGLSEIEPVNEVFRVSLGNTLSSLHEQALSD